VVRRAIAHAKGDLRGIDVAHTDAVLRLAESSEGRGGIDLPGVRVVRSFGEIRLSTDGGRAGFRCRIPRPLVPNPHFPVPAIRLELIEKPETSGVSDYVYNGEMGCVDWGRLSGSVELRTWQPGDRFQPSDASCPKKVKTLFQKARVPLWERAEWPVLAEGDAVIWTRRFGVAAGFRPGPSTRSILRIREIETPAAPVPPNSESGSGEPASK
jgi:tRNA(Ile)-lysidine synthase